MICKELCKLKDQKKMKNVLAFIFITQIFYIWISTVFFKEKKEIIKKKRSEKVKWERDNEDRREGYEYSG